MPTRASNKPAPRAKSLTAITRLKRAIELLTNFHRYEETIRMLVEEYGISRRQACTDIKRAYEELAECEREERPRKKAKLEAKLEEIMIEGAKGLVPGDRSAAVNAAKLYAKVNGFEDGTKPPPSTDSTRRTGVLVVQGAPRTAEDWEREYG